MVNGLSTIHYLSTLSQLIHRKYEYGLQTAA